MLLEKIHHRGLSISQTLGSCLEGISRDHRAFVCPLYSLAPAETKCCLPFLFPILYSLGRDNIGEDSGFLNVKTRISMPSLSGLLFERLPVNSESGSRVFPLY